MMGDKYERYNIQKKTRNLSFSTPLASPDDRQLKSFTVVILPALRWSNLFQFSGDWKCFGQTKSRSHGNFNWLYLSRSH